MAVLFYAFKIEPIMLIVKEITIEFKENASNEMKIVLFSDTHFKTDTSESYIEKIISKINDQNADVVMFLGDLIDNHEENPVDSDMIIKLFSEIDGEKFAVMGNHDYGGGAERTYKNILVNSDFQILINEAVFVDDIQIIGLDDLIFGKPDYDILIENDYENTIIILHEGDMIDNIEGNFDIAFAGHSHGGQIAIPYIKEIIMPKGAEKYINGLYEKIYVTSGIGTTMIDARLFCPPEIVVVTIKY